MKRRLRGVSAQAEHHCTDTGYLFVSLVVRYVSTDGEVHRVIEELPNHCDACSLRASANCVAHTSNLSRLAYSDTLDVCAFIKQLTCNSLTSTFRAARLRSMLSSSIASTDARRTLIESRNSSVFMQSSVSFSLILSSAFGVVPCS